MPDDQNSRSVPQGARRRGGPFQPQVVVKFRDDLTPPLSYVDGVEQEILQRGLVDLAAWGDVRAILPSITLRRLYTSLTPQQINGLVDKAMRNDESYTSPPNFLTYFVVDCPPGVDPEQVAAAFRTSAWPIVQTAYYDPPGGNPGVSLGQDRDLERQGYLKAAPQGVNARLAWDHPGGDGTGLKLIDLEEGWTLNHEDLPTGARTPHLLHGDLRDDSRDHGTPVLGIAAAQRGNAGRCVGIAYNVRALDVVSHAERIPPERRRPNGPQYTSNRPNAIMAALPLLEAGDVLLLEVQLMPGQDGPYSFMPIELLSADFETIRLATALGIVVVEPAGNRGGRAGNLDLRPALQRGQPTFRDSGAIMVAAAKSANQHVPLESTNYGSRIDCYAWGENVRTCTSNDQGARGMYTEGFSGTSSAAAIIAGVALAVQGLAQAGYHRRFTPRQLRAVLSNVQNGTARHPPLPAENPPKLIGVMPDLAKIIRNVLQLPPPDIYLRDSVFDTGDPGEGNQVSESPDIIVSRSLVADPRHETGRAGQTNYVYVRVRNRGPAAAENVEVRLFWVDRAGLRRPHLWTRIPTRSLPRVAAGDTPVLSEGFAWPAPQVSWPTDFDIIALVGHPDDPLPGEASDPNGFPSLGHFWRFVRANNNVAWRPVRVQ